MQAKTSKNSTFRHRHLWWQQENNAKKKKTKRTAHESEFALDESLRVGKCPFCIQQIEQFRLQLISSFYDFIDLSGEILKDFYYFVVTFSLNPLHNSFMSILIRKHI